ncbi:MAG: hypothetical protein LBC03_03095 [Nitrososphaerota archaeon]|jgi:hypothetical protein|nr:hypothetical protein [Nitrososphaerota archaeon]
MVGSKNTSESLERILKISISDGRVITFRVDDYIGNLKYFKDAALVIPIRDDFKVSGFKSGSIHGCFVDHLIGEGINVRDIQDTLDKSLNCLWPTGARKTFPGKIGSYAFQQDDRSRTVLFFGNSTLDVNSSKDIENFINEHGITAHHFWKNLVEGKYNVPERSILVPLLGGGNANAGYPKSDKEIILLLLDAYFEFCSKINKDIIISINHHVPEKVSWESLSEALEEYIKAKTKILGLSITDVKRVTGQNNVRNSKRHVTKNEQTVIINTHIGDRITVSGDSKIQINKPSKGSSVVASQRVVVNVVTLKKYIVEAKNELDKSNFSDEIKKDLSNMLIELKEKLVDEASIKVPDNKGLLKNIRSKLQKIKGSVEFGAALGTLLNCISLVLKG